MVESPIRKCVGCGTRRDKMELMRVVNNKNEIVIDPGGNLPGRGIYLCPNIECLDKARANNSIENELKKSLTEEDYHRLTEEISHVD